MTTKPFYIERVFETDSYNLWRALTEKELMKLWYFDLKEFKAEVGFTFQFIGGTKEGIQYTHLCEVTEVILHKKLTYSWKYEGYEGISYVTFELIEMGKKTKLQLTHAGLESFPISNSDFALHNFEAGWNHIINTSLKEFIESNFKNK